MYQRVIALAASAAVLSLPGAHSIEAASASSSAPAPIVSTAKVVMAQGAGSAVARAAPAPRVHALTGASGAPAITSRAPSPNRINVPRTTNVRVKFSEAVKATSSSIHLRDTKTGKYVTGAITYASATWAITFNPAPTLAAHRKYTVVVSGVQDKSGLVAKTSTWSFTTGG